MFALGQDFFAAGMLDRAESVFQELLESNSKWISKASICESLRTIYEQTQEWQKAIEATQCTKKNQKKDAPVPRTNTDSLITHYYCELADESLRQGNLHEVDGYIAKAKKSYKQSTRLMSLQGDIALHQKQYKEALTHYINAIKQDSRLLSMLIDRTEQAAKNSGETQYLQKALLNQYENNKDKNLFDAILHLAEKYGAEIGVDALVDKVLSQDKLSVKSIFKASEYIRDRNEHETEHNVKHSSEYSSELDKLHQSLSNHLHDVPSFRCEHCGYKMHDYLWRCPACNHWDTVDQT